MKKIYVQPQTNTVVLSCQQLMQTTSPGGVGTGGKPGDEFSEGDESYGRKSFSIWDDTTEE